MKTWNDSGNKTTFKLFKNFFELYSECFELHSYDSFIEHKYRYYIVSTRIVYIQLSSNTWHDDDVKAGRKIEIRRAET